MLEDITEKEIKNLTNLLVGKLKCSRELADDMIQQALLEAWVYVEPIRKLDAFLITIAERRWRNYIRDNEMTVVKFAPTDDEMRVSDRHIWTTDDHKTESFLGEADADILRELADGETYKEIAARHGCTVWRVRQIRKGWLEDGNTSEGRTGNS